MLIMSLGVAALEAPSHREEGGSRRLGPRRTAPSTRKRLKAGREMRPRSRGLISRHFYELLTPPLPSDPCRNSRRPMTATNSRRGVEGWPCAVPRSPSRPPPRRPPCRRHPAIIIIIIIIIIISFIMIIIIYIYMYREREREFINNKIMPRRRPSRRPCPSCPCRPRPQAARRRLRDRRELEQEQEQEQKQEQE